MSEIRSICFFQQDLTLILFFFSFLINGISKIWSSWVLYFYEIHSTVTSSYEKTLSHACKMHSFFFFFSNEPQNFKCGICLLRLFSNAHWLKPIFQTHFWSLFFLWNCMKFGCVIIEVKTRLMIFSIFCYCYRTQVFANMFSRAPIFHLFYLKIDVNAHLNSVF